MHSNAEKVAFYCENGKKNHKSNRWEEAITCYTEALQLNPGHKEAYLERANVFYVRGWFREHELNLQGLQFYEASISDYTKALELDPGCIKAYIGRCIASFDDSKELRSSQIEDLYQALKLGHNDEYTIFLLCGLMRFSPPETRINVIRQLSEEAAIGVLSTLKELTSIERTNYFYYDEVPRINYFFELVDDLYNSLTAKREEREKAEVKKAARTVSVMTRDRHSTFFRFPKEPSLLIARATADTLPPETAYLIALENFAESPVKKLNN